MPEHVTEHSRSGAGRPRLLDVARDAIRRRHYSLPDGGHLPALDEAVHPLFRQTASSRFHADEINALLNPLFS